MPDNENISVAKIAATPSATSWSQAYNAGKLFAVISLSKPTSEEDAKDYLNVLGKDVIETLEQEFFTIETKDLASIKNAFETAVKKIPEDIEASFLASSIVKNIIYIFYTGDTRVSIKRADEFGVLVDSKEKETGAASGIVKNEDTLIFQTKHFKELVPTNILVASLDHQPPNDIAEALAPIIHREEKSGAAAVILQYKSQESEEVSIKQPEEKEPENISEKSKFDLGGIFSPLASIIKIPKVGGISHSRKLILTIAVIVAILLTAVAFLTIKKQNETKLNTLFESVYSKAQEKYKGGESLVPLNKNLARDNFNEVYKILNDNKDKFPKNSTQEKQILDLLDKTQKALEETSGVNSVEAKQESEDVSLLLATAIKTGSNYVTADDKNIYFIKNGVVSLDKGNDKEKTVIKSEDLPSNIGGLGVYNGNVYILDKDKSQIYKFAGVNYSKSNYFSQSPSLSGAKAIAIDGSVWILSDGNVAKYTKGNSDNLNVTRLDKPLSNPTRIFTNADTDRVYILDNGNSRIIVINKSGEYQAQYQAGILKGAKDFEVKEKVKIIYILSGGKIYSIKLQ